MAYPYLQDIVEAATGLHVPLPLPTFGLCVAVAVLASMAVARLELRRLHAEGRIGLAFVRSRHGGPESVPPQHLVTDLALIVVISGIVGARLFSVAEYPHELADRPLALLLARQGFNFYGALVFGTLAGSLYLRSHRLPLAACCDALAPALMLGYAIGRIGCQLSGDGDWGVPANMALKPDWLPMPLWAQTYAHNIVGVAIEPPGVYPTPLYETAMGLALFGLLWSVRRHRFRDGWLFSLYLLLCALERLTIEPLRVNQRIHLLGLAATQAQIISAVLLLAGLTGLVLTSRGRRRPAPPSPRPA
jgi:phosphatidylglycerol:prolipoprotein diacylglycerol transferase